MLSENTKKYKEPMESCLNWMNDVYKDTELTSNDKMELINAFMLSVKYCMSGMANQSPDDVSLFLGMGETPTGISRTFIDKISLTYWDR